MKIRNDQKGKKILAFLALSIPTILLFDVLFSGLHFAYPSVALIILFVCFPVVFQNIVVGVKDQVFTYEKMNFGFKAVQKINLNEVKRVVVQNEDSSNCSKTMLQVCFRKKKSKLLSIRFFNTQELSEFLAIVNSRIHTMSS